MPPLADAGRPRKTFDAVNLGPDGVLRVAYYVEQLGDPLLDWKWSPQQISGTLERMYPNDSSQRDSRETIYTVKADLWVTYCR